MSATQTTPAPELKNLTHTLTSMDGFTGWMLTNPTDLHVAFLYAGWHEPSKPGGQMDTVVRKLAELNPDVLFAKIDAEEVSDVAEAFDVSVVPTFVMIKNKSNVDKFEGADAAELTARVERLKKAPAPPAPATGEAVQRALDELNARLERLMNANHVMLFMKGSPEAPRCKFSRKAVDMLRSHGVTFGSFDILTSDAVRQGLKSHSNWNTYPQVYVSGKLVGGCDILQELHDTGDWDSVFPPAEQLKPVKPGAGPSLADASAPPSTASAASVPAEMTAATRERLIALTQRSPVMLFMKGTAASPSCGFSAQMVTLLQKNGVSFDTFDILTDPEVRAGLKVIFNWNTFPQLYVRGELKGGLDVIRQMLEDDPATPLPVQLGI